MGSISDIKVLLHGNGENSSTNIIDSSIHHHDVIVNGDAIISTTQSKYGGSSLYFSGDDRDDRLDIIIDPIGTEDFCISFWMYPTRATPYYDTPFALTASNTYASSQLFIDLRTTTTDVNFLTTATSDGNYAMSHPINTWTYVTIIKTGGYISLYGGGTLSRTEANTYDYTATYLAIGSIYGTTSSQYPFEGYIDEFKLVVGDSVALIDPTEIPSMPTYVPEMPYYSMMDNCVAYWDFKDGNLYDVISNRYPTVTTGITTGTIDHLGQINNAITKTDDTNNTLSSSFTAGSNGITVAFVAKEGTFSTAEAIINTGTEYYIGYSSASQFRLYLDSTSTLIASGVNIFDSDWHVVIATIRDDVSYQVLLDGDDSGISYSTTPTTIQDITFSGLFAYYTGAYGMKCALSALLIYDRGLTESEMIKLTSLLQTRYIYPTQQSEVQE